MSVHAINWALEQKAGSQRAKLVLLILANHADDDGRCWPKQSTIAEQAEMNARTVRRAVEDLVAKKLLKVCRRRTKKGAIRNYEYRLKTPPDNLSPSPPDNLSPISAKHEAQRTLLPEDNLSPAHRTDCPVTTGQIVPSDEPSVEPSVSLLPTVVKKNIEIPALDRDLVQEIFDYWSTARHDALGLNGAGPALKLTTQRKQKIRLRLKDGFTADQLKTAIDQCMVSEWHRTNGQLELVSILRSTERVDTWLAKAVAPDVSENENDRVVREWVERAR